MVYLEEIYPEDILRKKMKEWGIIKDEHEDTLIHTLFIDWFDRFAIAKPTETIDVQGEIRQLKKRVSELESRVGGKMEPTEADYVYRLFKEELEKEHFGKIVAIDTDLKEIVGIGNTVLEAYKIAKEKTGKDQFDFRRVGYKYIYKV